MFSQPMTLLARLAQGSETRARAVALQHCGSALCSVALCSAINLYSLSLLRAAQGAEESNNTGHHSTSLLKCGAVLRLSVRRTLLVAAGNVSTSTFDLRSTQLSAQCAPATPRHLTYCFAVEWALFCCSPT